MPDEMTRVERDTAEIVAAYVRHHSLPADQVPALIQSVYLALSNLGKPAEQEVERTPAVAIRRSVTPQRVICLECGWGGKMLRRHLSSAHDLGPNEYRRRWNLKSDHPLTAPAYATQRSDLAKKLGLGRRDGAEAPGPKAATKRRTRKPSRSRDRRQAAAAQSE